MDYFIVIVLIVLSAIFSGLTLGFFSLNKDYLERKAGLGDKSAKKIYKIRKNGNLLLCTLLIGNVSVNTALSIFLGSIASGLIAGVIATSLIVIFGEIVPQAIFSRYALDLGSRFAWIVNIFVLLLLPITWPIAWILDKILGEEIPTVYSKQELAKLIEQHEESDKSDIDEEEERIIKGVLSYSDKNVRDIMTPRTEVMALESDQKLTLKLLKNIKKMAYSRIPVYKNDKDNIIGILYVKELLWEQEKNKTIFDVCHKKVIFIRDDTHLDDLLEEFKKTRNHLFVVLDEYGGMAGIVTIEDVIEEIIGAEIMDEFDETENLQKKAKIKARKKLLAGKNI